MLVRATLPVGLLSALIACQRRESAVPPRPAEPAPPPESTQIALYSLADAVPYPSAEEGAAAHVPEPEGADDGGEALPGMTREQVAAGRARDQSWRDRDSLWRRRGQAAAGQVVFGVPLCLPTLEIQEGRKVLHCALSVTWTGAPGLEDRFGLAAVTLDGTIAGFCRAFSPTDCEVAEPFVAGDTRWEAVFGAEGR